MSFSEIAVTSKPESPLMSEIANTTELLAQRISDHFGFEVEVIGKMSDGLERINILMVEESMQSELAAHDQWLEELLLLLDSEEFQGSPSLTRLTSELVKNINDFLEVRTKSESSLGLRETLLAYRELRKYVLDLGDLISRSRATNNAMVESNPEINGLYDKLVELGQRKLLDDAKQSPNSRSAELNQLIEDLRPQVGEAYINPMVNIIDRSLGIKLADNPMQDLPVGMMATDDRKFYVVLRDRGETILEHPELSIGSIPNEKYLSVCTSPDLRDHLNLPSNNISINLDDNDDLCGITINIGDDLEPFRYPNKLAFGRDEGALAVQYDTEGRLVKVKIHFHPDKTFGSVYLYELVDGELRFIDDIGSKSRRGTPPDPSDITFINEGNSIVFRSGQDVGGSIDFVERSFPAKLDVSTLFKGIQAAIQRELPNHVITQS